LCFAIPPEFNLRLASPAFALRATARQPSPPLRGIVLCNSAGVQSPACLARLRPSGYGAAAFASASRYCALQFRRSSISGLPRPPSPFGLRRGSLRFRFAVLCFAIPPEFNLRLASPAFALRATARQPSPPLRGIVLCNSAGVQSPACLARLRPSGYGAAAFASASRDCALQFRRSSISGLPRPPSPFGLRRGSLRFRLAVLCFAIPPEFNLRLASPAFALRATARQPSPPLRGIVLCNSAGVQSPACLARLRPSGYGAAAFASASRDCALQFRRSSISGLPRPPSPFGLRRGSLRFRLAVLCFAIPPEFNLRLASPAFALRATARQPSPPLRGIVLCNSAGVQSPACLARLRPSGYGAAAFASASRDCALQFRRSSISGLPRPPSPFGLRRGSLRLRFAGLCFAIPPEFNLRLASPAFALRATARQPSPPLRGIVLCNSAGVQSPACLARLRPSGYGAAAFASASRDCALQFRRSSISGLPRPPSPFGLRRGSLRFRLAVLCFAIPPEFNLRLASPAFALRATARQPSPPLRGIVLCNSAGVQSPACLARLRPSGYGAAAFASASRDCALQFRRSSISGLPRPPSPFGLRRGSLRFRLAVLCFAIPPEFNLRLASPAFALRATARQPSPPLRGIVLCNSAGVQSPACLARLRPSGYGAAAFASASRDCALQFRRSSISGLPRPPSPFGLRRGSLRLRFAGLCFAIPPEFNLRLASPAFALRATARQPSPPLRGIVLCNSAGVQSPACLARLRPSGYGAAAFASASRDCALQFRRSSISGLPRPPSPFGLRRGSLRFRLAVLCFAIPPEFNLRLASPAFALRATARQPSPPLRGIVLCNSAGVQSPACLARLRPSGYGAAAFASASRDCALQFRRSSISGLPRPPSPFGLRRGSLRFRLAVLCFAIPPEFNLRLASPAFALRATARQPSPPLRGIVLCNSAGVQSPACLARLRPSGYGAAAFASASRDCALQFRRSSISGLPRPPSPFGLRRGSLRLRFAGLCFAIPPEFNLRLASPAFALRATARQPSPPLRGIVLCNSAGVQSPACLARLRPSGYGAAAFASASRDCALQFRRSSISGLPRPPSPFGLRRGSLRFRLAVLCFAIPPEFNLRLASPAFALRATARQPSPPLRGIVLCNSAGVQSPACLARLRPSGYGAAAFASASRDCALQFRRSSISGLPRPPSPFGLRRGSLRFRLAVLCFAIPPEFNLRLASPAFALRATARQPSPPLRGIVLCNSAGVQSPACLARLRPSGYGAAAFASASRDCALQFRRSSISGLPRPPSPFGLRRGSLRLRFAGLCFAIPPEFNLRLASPAFALRATARQPSPPLRGIVLCNSAGVQSPACLARLRPSGYGAAAFASASRDCALQFRRSSISGLPRPPSPFGLRRGSLRFRFAVLCFAIPPEFNLRLASPAFALRATARQPSPPLRGIVLCNSAGVQSPACLARLRPSGYGAAAFASASRDCALQFRRSSISGLPRPPSPFGLRRGSLRLRFAGLCFAIPPEFNLRLASPAFALRATARQPSLPPRGIVLCNSAGVQSPACLARLRPSGYGAAAFASASRDCALQFRRSSISGLPRPPSPFGLRRGSLRFRFAVLCFAIPPEFNLRLASPAFALRATARQPSLPLRGIVLCNSAGVQSPACLARLRPSGYGAAAFASASRYCALQLRRSSISGLPRPPSPFGLRRGSLRFRFAVLCFATPPEFNLRLASPAFALRATARQP